MKSIMYAKDIRFWEIFEDDQGNLIKKPYRGKSFPSYDERDYRSSYQKSRNLPAK